MPLSSSAAPLAAPLPFADLRVLELASVLAGPQVGQFFAELGATVLKVEAPAGDVTRTWKTRAEAAATDVSAYFSCANWGKQSVVLDLTTEAGKAQVQRLAARADVVIASYKPGDAEKLGVDYNTLQLQNPQLIYAHLTGYGPTVARAGYDAVLQAEAGFMYLNAQPGQEPQKMPVALIDLLAAHQLKEGLLTALYHRCRSGQGSLVQVFLLDSALASLANQAATWLVTGHDPQPLGSGHPSIVPYGTVYRAGNGRSLVLAVGADRQFRHLCQALSRPEWAQDARFQTNEARVAHRAALESLLQARMAEVNGDELLAALEQLGVPAGAVRTVGEALARESGQEMLLPAGEAGFAGLRTVAFQSSSWPRAASLAPPPHLGEHSAAAIADQE
ncbi:CaiB/BaiF CoA transferase family protein [Hymenobacter chitinivorans]|uniref:Crotonobetainyl-CoA:carnitine CoA-transferase CaiB-like acyl-CoA transferase n=1 Tax=Hymenobacter chitinivorans DSM 11115 TaxID=1121954 RepID=A0A2M9BTJ7_9BACT|nr:CaiB/BaiF CoA-transferase family protein [Hymenobacter chitinivorans]PJJ61265.1 crotonobetainyl-CoA:carnitine CoA-transferase CaiB-like acyl-CoA transferase [Hymenobacter chitinivorans DSM 11115]